MKYSAYNLTIQSELPLPLPQCQFSEHPDIIITVGETEEPEHLSRTYDGVWYAHGENSLFLKWDRIGSYLIREGKWIVISQSHAPRTMSPVVPLLGTVMAIAMHQRGMTSLHGSSVLVDGAAIIFLGEKGEGKSTIAGYFQKQGHSLLSDDVCAIDMQRQESPTIYPSFSRIKLWPDAMHYLEYAPEQHERVHPEFEKRNISLDAGFSFTPSPVAAIIVLTTGSDVSLEALTGHQAIPFILPHLIINRFPENQPDKLARNIYYQLTNLIKHVPLYRLTRPRDISLLPIVAELVGDIR